MFLRNLREKLPTLAALCAAGVVAVFGGVLQEFSTDDVPRLAAEQGLSIPLADPNVYVSTRRGVLELRDGDVVVQSYDCGFGSCAAFGARGAGLRSTPIGEYRVVAKSERRDVVERGARFLRLDYPNAEDARRALENGVLDRATAESIFDAAAAGLTPPADTPLGGPLGIQGNRFFFQPRHHTDGAISLANADVVELFKHLPEGARVVIGD